MAKTFFESSTKPSPLGNQQRKPLASSNIREKTIEPKYSIKSIRLNAFDSKYSFIFSLSIDKGKLDGVNIRVTLS